MIFNTNFSYNNLQEIFKIIIQTNFNDYNDNNYIINNFIIDNVSFKRLKYYNNLEKIKSILERFYLNKYKFYITRNINYQEFLTIIRQLCKHFGIEYKMCIKYSFNEKEIFYEILYKDYCECIKNKLPNNVSDSNTC